MVLRAVVVSVVWLCASCAASSHPASAPAIPSVPLVGARGEVLDARSLAANAPLTVLVFFSPDCHCLAIHEPRLRVLSDAYRARGVRFFMVDSEERGSVERDASEAARRGYPFPILGDRGAKLADALGAEYATYSVVFDAQARVRYRGGIDTDKSRVHDDATPYLRAALDDLLAGHDPRIPEGKTLGCSLQKW
jgi:hypothetical protein